MKTIPLVGSAGDLRIDVGPGRAKATHEVDVYDRADELIATVAVYPDGTAETVWRTGWDPYRSYGEQWWQDMCAEVAKAVLS